MHRSQTPSIHLSTSAFMGVEFICEPDQVPDNIWYEPILPVTMSGAFTMNGLQHAYLSIILLVPICKMGSCPMLQGQLAWPKFVY